MRCAIQDSSTSIHYDLLRASPPQHPQRRAEKPSGGGDWHYGKRCDHAFDGLGADHSDCKTQGEVAVAISIHYRREREGVYGGRTDGSKSDEKAVLDGSLSEMVKPAGKSSPMLSQSKYRSAPNRVSGSQMPRK